MFISHNEIKLKSTENTRSIVWTAKPSLDSYYRYLAWSPSDKSVFLALLFLLRILIPQISGVCSLKTQAIPVWGLTINAHPPANSSLIISQWYCSPYTTSRCFRFPRYSRYNQESNNDLSSLSFSFILSFLSLFFFCIVKIFNFPFVLLILWWLSL